ncbi:MAG: restriction endonuclease subunit S, partial [Bacilli bacterium]|nr:restriction endonuclease subunit S [Bacilli bacterium]
KGTVQSSKREEGEYTFITASDTWLTHSEYTHDCEALVFVFGAGGSLGKVHYTNGRKFVASDLCFILTPKDPKNTNLKYYYAYFNSRRKEIVQRLARGTNKKAINDTRFQDYIISFPNKAEQDRVGLVVDEIFNNVESYKEKIDKEYSKLDNLV